MQIMSVKGIKDITYSIEVTDEIILRYSGGETLSSICRSDNMPTRSTIWKWSKAYQNFSESLSDAREAHADSIADEITDIADTEKDPQKARNRIDARKWSAGVHNPARYSPKIDLNITERVDLVGARTEARARLARSVRDRIGSAVVQVIESTREAIPGATDKQSEGTEEIDIFS